MSKLPTMKDRYKNLLYKFAVKCVTNPKTEDMIPLRNVQNKGRNKEKYSVSIARKQRLYQSAIPTMARMLNSKPISI